MTEKRSREERIVAAKREIRQRSLEGIERRTVPMTVEVRASSEAEGEFTIEGHAAVFDDLSEDLGFFETWFERIEKGAFATVLRKNPDVRALLNHDYNFVLARSANGTLRLAEDDEGLHYEADVAPTSYGNDLRILLERGDINQSSFAFRVARKGDSWEEDEDGNLVRTIHQFSELYDVSPVAVPAYPTTDVSLASRDLPDADGVDDVEAVTTAETPAPDGERHDDEPAEQRVEDGPAEERQADGDAEQGYLARAKRRMALRERA